MYKHKYLLQLLCKHASKAQHLKDSVFPQMVSQLSLHQFNPLLVGVALMLRLILSARMVTTSSVL